MQNIYIYTHTTHSRCVVSNTERNNVNENCIQFNLLFVFLLLIFSRNFYSLCLSSTFSALANTVLGSACCCTAAAEHATQVPSNLVTQTVYGFLDFTTTIGNTVMVFSPQSAPPPGEFKSFMQGYFNTKKISNICCHRTHCGIFLVESGKCSGSLLCVSLSISRLLK